MPWHLLPVGLVALAASAPLSVLGASPQECRFTYRPLAVGDAARETIRFAVTLKTIRSQEGQVVDLAEQAVERNEHSLVVRLPAEPGQTAKARLTYETSHRSTQTRGDVANESRRPVDGKTYLVARQGDELRITDDQGATPPEEERAIVERTMEGLGRPNPLGTFFHGRALSVGQTVRLPSEFTAKLLSGWGDALGKLPLDVMLIGTERVDGQTCALLHTPPGASDNKGLAPVEGKLLIELDTCRVAQLDLRGPITTSERRGAPGQEFDVRRKGKLQVAVHVEHQRAR